MSLAVLTAADPPDPPCPPPQDPGSQSLVVHSNLHDFYGSDGTDSEVPFRSATTGSTTASSAATSALHLPRAGPTCCQACLCSSTHRVALAPCWPPCGTREQAAAGQDVGDGWRGAS